MTAAPLSSLPVFAQTIRNYFNLSTWKGRVVCAAGLLAGVSLIALFIRYIRKPAPPAATATKPPLDTERLLETVAARFSSCEPPDTPLVLSTPPEDGSSPLLNNLPDDLLYLIIYTYVGPDIVALTAFRCTCTKIHTMFFAHLSSLRGTASFIQAYIEPWIAHCSQEHRCDEQHAVVDKTFQTLAHLPKSVRLPASPNAATVPVMQKMFARLEELCRRENYSDPLTGKIGAIIEKLAEGQGRLDLQPKVARFLYNLPSVRLIGMCTLTAVSEVSRRHDSKLLTAEDQEYLYWPCAHSGNGVNGNFAGPFIQGVSVPFLKQILRVYAKRKEIDNSNEFFINSNISVALCNIKDPKDAYQKLLVCLEFYKEKYGDNFTGWTHKSAVYHVLYCILWPVVLFLYKHPLSDLLLQQEIGTWMCKELKDLDRAIRHLTFRWDLGPYSVLKPKTPELLPEIETLLKEAAFIHQPEEPLSPCKRTILTQLNEEFLLLDSIDKAALSLPLEPGSFLHKAIQYRLKIVVDKALPRAIDRLCAPHDYSVNFFIRVGFNGTEHSCGFSRLKYCSGYFAAMKEAVSIDLCVPNEISPAAVEQVLHYLQTSTVAIHDDSCLELWRAACFLQVSRMQLLCEQRLIEKLMDGSFTRGEFAETDLALLRQTGSHLSTALECLAWINPLQ